jgi:hypothetical protein
LESQKKEYSGICLLICVALFRFLF